jgi:thiol-disulfide isomerase/thioredoxin
MKQVVSALGLIAALASGMVSAAAQKPAEADVVSAVRAAIASRGVAEGERTLNEYRAISGVTPEIVEALAWLARGALAAKQFDKANGYSANAYELAALAFKDRVPGDDLHIRRTLGVAIETRASVMVEQGARSEAVTFLRGELETYRNTPVHGLIQADVDRISLEGRPAPRLETRLRVGPRVPSNDELKGRVVLLFFWAHWCPECKAESPTMAKLRDRYRSQGLAIVAPTQRYGYVEAGRPAAPDKELRHIIDVRNTHYGFLRDEPVPLSDANFKEYGVTTIPMHVLLDRQGVVRLYNPGRMTEEELEDAIRKLL